MVSKKTSFPAKSLKRNSRSRTDFFYYYWKLRMTDQNNFRHQPFFAVSGRPGGKVPAVDDVLSSLEQEVHPTASHVEMSMQFDFSTDHNV